MSTGTGSETAYAALAAAVGELELVDHHVHGAFRADLDRAGLEVSLTEAEVVPPWMSQFDSQVGLAVRRWCAPVLDLAPHASPDAYVARRRELGTREVTRRLLRASGVGRYLVDTGYAPERLLSNAELGELSGAEVREVVRIEHVAADLAVSGVSAADFPGQFRERLSRASSHAVGLKSVIAYLHDLDFDPARPADGEVVRAAGPWLRAVEEQGPDALEQVPATVLRFLLWQGIDRGLPLQLHTGYGSLPIRLDHADPLRLTPWLRLTQSCGVQVLLLHCYPFHREAGYLAQVFPHVFLDVGLAVNFTGARSDAVVAESLELAPFGKVLFSSDAWGPPELHHLGATLWRRGVVRSLGPWVAGGDWSLADALRVASMIGRENAERVYGLG